MRRVAGLLILFIGLGSVAGGVAVVLGLVGGPTSTWRHVFRGMGGVLAAIASSAYALGGVALLADKPRLRMFTAWAGVQGLAMAMGCLIASLILTGTRQLVLAGAGVFIGAVSVYALGSTIFRGARWNAAPDRRKST